MKRTPLNRGKPMHRGISKMSRSKPKARADWRDKPGEDLLEASKALVYRRSRGRCERCTMALIVEKGDVHHRRPRQMGGDPSAQTNGPANLVHLCRACHEWCESHRTEAMATGWLVPRGVAVPGEVPLVPLRGVPFRLTDDGDYRLVA